MKDKKYLFLIMIIITLVIVNVGTVAYYMNAINGKIKGNIGAFTFDALNNGSTLTNIDLYDTMENPSLTERYIVPGDSGKFDILIKADGTSTGVEYEMDFTGKNIPSNMQFYLDESKSKAVNLENGLIGYFKKEDATKQKTYTIYWVWPFDSGYDSLNKQDINYQGKEMSLDVTIVGKQSNGYAMMKNGSNYGAGVGMWDKTYSPKVETINFSTDLSNLPNECTEANLCWDITHETSSYPVYHYLVQNASDTSKYDAYIVSEKEIYAPNDSSFLFSLQYISVTEESYMAKSKYASINFNNVFNTSKVRNMNIMFYAENLTSLDLSSFNTNNVKIMDGLFMECKSLQNITFGTDFKTDKVTNMSWMFYRCSSLTNLDLSSFNTSKVTDMSQMFTNCSSLTSLNISKFDTTNVVKMDRMFAGCSKLTTTINIKNPNLTNYSYIFTSSAITEGAQITVNYVASASTLVDKMIATKSANSNVVKGTVIS